MTLEKLERLRTKWIPTWSSLRSIGSSRAVQASVAFPVFGYLILLSSQFTSIFDGGLAGTGKTSTPASLFDQLWALKLYYVYFGLLNLGIGSAVYQLYCPRQIKKHGDWEDYVRIDGASMSNQYIVVIGEMLGRDHSVDLGTSPQAWSDLKIQCLRLHYGTLSAEAKLARSAVTFFFFSGLSLLSIPSLMTAFKIALLLIRSPTQSH
jgi:hypothetical protein